MSVDQQVREAGLRLAELPVEVPEFDALVRHNHRRRSFVMSGAITLLMVVVAGSVLVLRQPDNDDIAPATRHPVTEELLGLGGVDGVWGRVSPTAEEAAQTFARDVLGWVGTAVDAEENPQGSTYVTVISGDRSVVVRVFDLEDGWRADRVGEGIDIGLHDGGTMLTSGVLPPGTVAVRSWVLSGGPDASEATATHTDPPFRVLVDIPPAAVVSAVVIFLDADGTALGASGNSMLFAYPRGANTPADNLPTFNLGFTDAVLVSDEETYPTVVDSAVWVSGGGRTYLTQSVRPGVGERTSAGFGLMTEDEEFPDESGRAWFTTDAGERVSSLRMWWARPDGDVWLLSMHWPGGGVAVPHRDAVTQLRAWALAIKPAGEPGTGYILDLQGVERMASEAAGLIRHRARVWGHPEGEILLTWSESVATGLTNALERESVPTVVYDTEGWLSVDPNGAEPTRMAWESENLWFTLEVPPALTGDIHDIVASIERE